MGLSNQGWQKPIAGLMAAACLFSGCSVDLAIPARAVVKCTSNADCAGDWTCNTEAGRCVTPGESLTAPIVSISSIAPVISTASFEVIVVDPDNEPVTLQAWIRAAGAKQPITLVPSEVSGSKDGTAASITWDAAAYFGDSERREGLIIELRGVDADLEGPTANSEVFIYGNVAPTITTFAPTVAGALSGVVDLRWQVQDSAGDALMLDSISLITQEGVTQPIPLNVDNFPGFDSFALSTGAETILHWDTGLAAPIKASGLRLAATIRDNFGQDGVVSAVYETAPLVIDNSPAASLTILAAALSTPPLQSVPMTVAVTDPNAAETIGVVVEYSVGATGVWHLATLLPSSDPHDALAPGAQGQVQWDMLGDADRDGVLSVGEAGAYVGYTPTVQLRVVPTDSSGLVGTPTAAQTLTVGNDAPVVTNVYVDADIVAGEVIVWIAIADSSGDAVSIETIEVVDGATYTPIALDNTNFPGVSTLVLQSDGFARPMVWNSGAALPTVQSDLRLAISIRDASGAVSYVLETPLFGVDNGPVVSLGPIAATSGVRDINAVSFNLTVSDPNGAAPLAETVSVRVEYAVGPDFVPQLATPLTGTNPTAPLAGTSTSANFVWDVLADAEAGNAGLAAAPIDPSTANPKATTFTQDGVVLILTATDSSGVTRVPSVQSQAFTVGNDAPVATLLGSELTGSYAGRVPVGFTIADTSTDIASIELQFRLPGDTLETDWRAAKIVGGATDGLASSVSGAQFVVVWDSAASLNVDSSIPQGIGAEWLKDIELRIRASDRPDGNILFYGEWSATATVPEIRNQTPPQIDEISFYRPAGVGGVAPFFISFRLFDAQSDPVDIRVEEATNFDATGQPTGWRAVPEFKVPASEGLYNLSTAPQSLNAPDGGGIQHFLGLDPTGLYLWPQINPVYRITATDGFPADNPRYVTASFPIADPLGPVGGSMTLNVDSTINISGLADLETADVNSDGIPDLIVLNSSVNVYLGNGANGRGDGTFSLLGSYSVTASGAASLEVGFLDGDDILDLAVSANPSTWTGRFSVLIGNGDGSFQAGVVSADLGINTDHIALGDFNNDTFVDISVYGRGNDAQVFFGNGTGTYSSTPNFSGSLGGRFAPAHAVADLNGDDFDDLVAPSGTDSGNKLIPQIAFRLSNGDGTFGAVQSVNVGVEPKHVLASDLDGDGDIDLLVTNLTSNNVYTLWNDGAAAFSAGPIYAGDERATAAALADFNRDGFAELIVANADFGTSELGSVVVFPGSGNGGVPSGVFAARGGVVFPSADNPESLVVGDFNADGATDVALASRGLNRITIMLSTFSSGSNSASLLALSSFSDLGPSSIAPGDFNADGVTDLAIGARWHTGVRMLLGGGPAGIGGGTDFSVGGSLNTAFQLSPVCVADFDLDGILDVGTRNSSGRPVVGFGAGASGVGEGAFATSWQGTDLDVWSVAASDMNTDGWVDLVVGREYSNAIGGNRSGGSVFLNQGDRTFALAGELDILDAPGSGNGLSDLALGDFNGDRHLDVAIAHNKFPSFYVFAGDGTGGLTQIGSEALGRTRGSRICAADFDGDGITDIGVSVSNDSGNSQAAQVHFGNGSNGVGNGTFTVPTEAMTSNGALPIACEDFNLDGYADMGISEQSASAVSLWLGNSVRTFTEVTDSPVPVGDFLMSLGAADFNGDHVADLIAGSRDSRDAQVVLVELGVASLPWGRTLGQTGLQVIGGDTLPIDIDRFGEIHTAHLTQHLNATPAYKRELLQAMADATNRLVSFSIDALTHPWTIEGDRHFVRIQETDVLEDDADPLTGPRLRVVDRLGTRNNPGVPTDMSRSGLDLTAATPRGIVIELPIFDSHTDTDILTAVSAGDVHVYRRSIDWLRASDVAEDPFTANPSASAFLPRIPVTSGLGGYRDVVAERVTWTEIAADPDNDFTTDDCAGACFVVQAGAGHKVVRVRTDKLGTFQAAIRR